MDTAKDITVIEDAVQKLATEVNECNHERHRRLFERDHVIQLASVIEARPSVPGQRAKEQRLFQGEARSRPTADHSCRKQCGPRTILRTVRVLQVALAGGRDATRRAKEGIGGHEFSEHGAVDGVAR